MANKFSSSYQYLEAYNNLQNGHYEYNVAGQTVELYTIFENNEGWIRAVDISSENNLHINEQFVPGVKQSDEVIDALLTTNFEYSIMTVADTFGANANDRWLTYPRYMYVHSSIERFSSTTPSHDIENSCLLSLDSNTPPLNVMLDAVRNTYAFGNGNIGDTFFGYGSNIGNGFFQSFSGPGKGSVYVR